MKVAILAGGLGTRLAEETELRPKPMVEIGGRPILWHIMKQYAAHGFKEFAVAAGYKGEMIKRFVLDDHTLSGNIRVDFATGAVKVDHGESTDWVVTVVDTGQDSQTGGRLGRLQPVLGRETFLATYGDGVSNVDLKALVAFHRAHGKIATVTAVRPPARFGALVFDGDRVERFSEKPQAGEGWINGGFFVFEPALFDYIDGDDCVLEADVLERLAGEGELVGYRHEGFWQCMDTLRERRLLESLWAEQRAPWKVW